MFFLLLATLYCVGERGEVTDYGKRLEARKAAEDVAVLVSLASGTTHAFYTRFYTPSSIGGEPYSLNVTPYYVYVTWANESYIAVSRAAQVTCTVCPINSSRAVAVRKTPGLFPVGGMVYVEAA